MFDQNVIAQLSQLKENIVASKEYAEGVVVGANGRYGFVKLPDGRNAFLNPEKMQRVLPGDKVKISMTKNDKDQLEAHLEELLEKPLTRFVGRYRVKGNAHFVEPEMPQFNRWLFIPPKSRQKCEANDLVMAELAHHPYHDGKASANIVTLIGKEDAPYVHHNTVIAQFDLQRNWGSDTIKQSKDVCDKVLQDIEGLTDHTSTPFVTIDSASTRDMDDAVFCETHADGSWTLTVAIANPAAYIAPNSPLAKQARYYAQSVYLPGRSLPMLPEQLATDTFSLLPEQVKPALLCEMTIGADGTITRNRFEQGKIRSHHKLSYVDVSQFLEGESAALGDCNEEILTSLRALQALAEIRQSYRKTHNLVHDDQPDYDLMLDKNGLIESIQKRERNLAHKLIEEAMLAANIAAGNFLAEHQCGLFSTHQGIRHDRLGEARALLREELGEDFDTNDIQELPGFLRLINYLQGSDEHRHLLAPLRRMMNNAELDTKLLPHMNMGLSHYATITSPIRRFADLSNHWTINQILADKKPQTLPEPALEKLRENIGHGRQAGRQLEQTLMGLYLKDRIGLRGIGCIRIVTQQGFGVKLIDTGIEGFVQFPKSKEKSFDAKRMTLTVDGETYAIDREVDVTVAGVDLQKRRVKMKLAGTAEEKAEEAPNSAQELAQTHNASE